MTTPNKSSWTILMSAFGTRERRFLIQSQLPLRLDIWISKLYVEFVLMAYLSGKKVQSQSWFMVLILLSLFSFCRYLCELEAPGDPAWKCIDNQQQWLLKLLLKCKNEHLQIGRSCWLSLGGGEGVRGFLVTQQGSVLKPAAVAAQTSA